MGIANETLIERQIWVKHLTDKKYMLYFMQQVFSAILSPPTFPIKAVFSSVFEFSVSRVLSWTR